MNPQHRHRADPNQTTPIPATDNPRHTPPPPRRIDVNVVALARRWFHAVADPTTGSRARARLITSLLGLLVIAIATVSYRTAVNAGKPDGNTAPTHHVTYQATSTGKTVIVTYTQGSNGLDGQTTAPSPWSIATDLTASVAVLTVTSGTDSHNPDRADSVTCAIVDTASGQTLVRNAVPASAAATVTCVTSNLDA